MRLLDLIAIASLGLAASMAQADLAPMGVFIATEPLERIDPRSPDSLPGFQTEAAGYRIRTAPSLNRLVLTHHNGGRTSTLEITADGIPLHRPTGIVATPDAIFIADTGNRRIVRIPITNTALQTDRATAITHPDFRRPIGLATAASGELLVADSWSDRIFVFDLEGQYRRTLSQHGSQQGFLSGPIGIDTFEHELFVADARNSRVQVFDLRTGAFQSEWGLHVIRPHEAEGHLHYPTTITISPDGAAATVTEPWEDRQQIFRRAAADTDTIPQRLPLSADDFVHYGRGIDTYDRLLAITDPDTHTVRIFDLSLDKPVLIGVLGAYGDAPHQFIHPSSVAFIPPSEAQPLRLVVADRGSARLALYAIDWNAQEPLRFRPTLASFQRAVSMPALHRFDSSGRWARPIDPVSICLTTGNSIVVLDDANSAVHTFDLRLRQTGSLALPKPADAPSVWSAIRPGPGGRIACIDSASARLIMLESTDAGLAHAHTLDLAHIATSPTDVLLTETAMHIVDSAQHRIIELDPDGSPRNLVGGEGLGAGEFFKPTSVIALADGRIAVVDRGNHRLQIFAEQWKLESIDGPRLYIAPAKIGEPANVRPVTPGTSR